MGDTKCAMPSLTPLPPIFLTIALNDGPPVEFGSCQLVGESMQAYLEHLVLQRTCTIARETRHDHQSQLSRETAMKVFPIPGHQGPMVFLWIDHNGFHMRTRCDHQVITERWTTYCDTMRRYDSIHNEWDLCTEFDPENDDSTLASLQCFSDAHHFNIQLVPPSPPTSPLPPSQEFQLDDRSPDYVFNSLISSIYYGYGFLVSTTESHPELDVAGWSLGNVHKYILDGQLPLVGFDNRTSVFVCTFFHALASSTGLSASNSDLFDDSLNPTSLPAAPVISPVVLDNEQFFQFHFSGEYMSSWSIYLHDPASVLQVFQQRWYDEPSTLLVQLLQRGIAVNTYIATNPSNPVGPPPLHSQIPIELRGRALM